MYPVIIETYHNLVTEETYPITIETYHVHVTIETYQVHVTIETYPVTIETYISSTCNYRNISRNYRNVNLPSNYIYIKALGIIHHLDFLRAFLYKAKFRNGVTLLQNIVLGYHKEGSIKNVLCEKKQLSNNQHIQ